jgi:hypothetical protein
VLGEPLAAVEHQVRVPHLLAAGIFHQRDVSLDLFATKLIGHWDHGRLQDARVRT